MAKRPESTKIILLIQILLTAFFALQTSNKAFAAMTESECLDSARSKLTTEYVDKYLSSFQERCKKGVTVSSDSMFGMEAPIDADYPESTGKEGFYFMAQRIVAGFRSETGKENIYGTMRYFEDIATISGTKTDKKSRPTIDCWVGSTSFTWTKGATFKVTIEDSFFTRQTGKKGTESGIVEDKINYTSCYKGYIEDKNCANNHLYFKVYEITEIKHNESGSVSFDGESSGSGGSREDPILISSGGNITFTHQLKRDDAWGIPKNPTITDVWDR